MRDEELILQAKLTETAARLESATDSLQRMVALASSFIDVSPGAPIAWSNKRINEYNRAMMDLAEFIREYEHGST